MADPGWYSVLPPVIAIVLAIWSKQVILSLFAGIWMGHTLLNQFNPLAGITRGLDGVIDVFTDPGDARVLIFTLLIGSLIATIERSGGVRGFVHYLETRRWVHNGFRAQFLAWVASLRPLQSLAGKTCLSDRCNFGTRLCDDPLKRMGRCYCQPRCFGGSRESTEDIYRVCSLQLLFHRGHPAGRRCYF
jgi:hypothetical protein